jgi:hypothetical protein
MASRVGKKGEAPTSPHFAAPGCLMSRRGASVDDDVHLLTDG